jgi:CHAD domain-containing protein
MGRLHNQNISRGGGAALGGELHLRKLAQQFDLVLDRCRDGAGVEEVHRLRTGSRRLEAMVESILRRSGSRADILEKPARAWLRQMKKLRRAAGAVRDLDVHRKLLRRAARAGAAPARQPGAISRAAEPAFDEAAALPSRSPVLGVLVPGSLVPSSFAQELRAFDTWLGERRHKNSAALMRKAKKRRGKLADRQAAFFAAMESPADGRFPRNFSAARLAFEEFACATDAMPALSAKNLHAFRKRVKKARYVAESEGGEAAAALAGALKRVQDAIGEWHDWQRLTEEAKTALKDGAPLLTPWLEQRRSHALVRALRVTRRARARILDQQERILVRRKPAALVERKPPMPVPAPAFVAATGAA